MADVQLENGYTRVANDLLDALARARIHGRWFQVMHAVMRLTYGYNKSEDRIASSQVAEVTSLDVSNVRSIMRDLVSAGMLERDGGTGHAGVWRVQKDYEKWVNPGRRRPRSCTTQVVRNPGRGRPGGRVVDNPETWVVDNPHQRQKDILPKTQSPAAPAAATRQSPEASKGRTRAARTMAPETLPAEALAALRRWCESSEPWAAPHLDTLVANCLDHFRGQGKPMADWAATCRNWVRNQRMRYGGLREPVNGAPRPAEKSWDDMTPEEQRECARRADEASRKVERVRGRW